MNEYTYGLERLGHDLRAVVDREDNICDASIGKGLDLNERQHTFVPGDRLIRRRKRDIHLAVLIEEGRHRSIRDAHTKDVSIDYRTHCDLLGIESQPKNRGAER